RHTRFSRDWSSDVCSSDLDLEMLDERVRSRLSGGLVVPINGFDLDLRRAIVNKRAEQASQRFAGVHFPPAVIDYIARVVVSHGQIGRASCRARRSSAVGVL